MRRLEPLVDTTKTKAERLDETIAEIMKSYPEFWTRGRDAKGELIPLPPPATRLERRRFMALFKRRSVALRRKVRGMRRGAVAAP